VRNVRLHAAKQLNRDASEDGEPTTATNKPVHKMKRKRRTLSLEAEIKLKARQIMDEQMAEAMKAAALMIVGRKLDEIRQILGAAGLAQPGMVPSGQRIVVGAIGQNGAANGTVHQNPNPSVEHPCVQCGREGVRRTKPNRFNRTGSWYCAAHVRMAAQSDGEDAMDSALLGGTAQPPMTKQPVVAAAPPVEMARPNAPAPVQEAAGEASLDAAMASLGVN